MPASRSPKQNTEPVRRSYGWLVVVGILAAAAVVASALPASLALRFLPADIQANDPSGSLWHGSFGQVTARGRNVGAVEWHVHPLALVTGELNADVHWVKQNFVADGTLKVSRGRFAVRTLKGGGSLEDLADFGITRGWNGGVDLDITDYAATINKVTAALGSITLSHLTSKQFGSVDIGDFELRFEPDAVRADGTAVATVKDHQGLLQVDGIVTISPAQRTATLSGTVKERGSPPPALHDALNELVQLRGRDREGRIPVELEFSL